jgi:outer membrane receptor protein involved in Fe transport
MERLEGVQAAWRRAGARGRLTWLCAAGLLAPPAGAAELAGRVVDARDGRALAGVVVDVGDHGLRVETDHDGRFRAGGLGAGPLRLRVQAPGYLVADERVELPAQAAGAPAEVELRLYPSALTLHESVVVAAERDARPAFESARVLSVVTADGLERRVPRTAPESLMELGQVWVQKTNHGGGSPFLRGLTGNHVLVLVDGIRLNNSTFRYGPNQYLATVDPLSLERVEVVRGVGSVLYGSDALGGVINVVSERPAFAAAGTTLSAALDAKLAGPDVEQTGRARLALAGRNAALAGSFTLRDTGDLRAGGGLGVEAPSGYREAAGDAQALLRLGGTGLLTLAYQYLRQDDVPRWDQVAQRGFSLYAFDPQVRRLAYAQLGLATPSAWLESLRATVSLQRSDETRVRQQRGSRVRVHERDVVDTWGASLELHGRPRGGVRLVAGADVYQDDVRSGRLDTNLDTAAAARRRGLYPDGATALSAAGFLDATWTRGRLTAEAGGRVSRFEVEIPDDGLFGASRIAPTTFAGRLALAYEAAPGLRAYASLAQGFRAPNVDDLSTLGPFDFGIEVPSPSLVPERALGYELGLKLRRAPVQAALALYRSELSDLIDRVPDRFQGSDTYEGQRVFRRANVGRAYIQGAEGFAEWHVAGPWTLFGSTAYAFGEVKDTGAPVRRIPPLHGELALRHERPGGARVEAELRWAARQDRLAPGDKADHRINPAGTPGWRVLNLRAAWPLRSGLRLVGGVENVFDEGYRVHGSGLDGYGRYAWLGLHARF